MGENLNSKEGKEKYLRLRAGIFDSIRRNPKQGEESLAVLKRALSNIDQNYLERGISPDDPQCIRDKEIASAYLFKHQFPRSEENRGEYVQQILISSGYSPEEREVIDAGIKRKEEGLLEKKL
jgi:hypothetical protein